MTPIRRNSRSRPIPWLIAVAKASALAGVGVAGNVIASALPGAGKVISGNGPVRASLSVRGASGKSVAGNTRGASAGGLSALPNGWGGVLVLSASLFRLDDGSGVSVNVQAPGHNLPSGSFVLVRAV